MSFKKLGSKSLSFDVFWS